MSKLSGLLDPEPAPTSKPSPPRYDPAATDPTGPTIRGRDARTPAQRRHDAFSLGMANALSSGKLGTHRGHPVTVVITTTLTELNQAAHASIDPAIAMPPPAHTGGGSRLPMRDLIAMAATAIHYLAVFDDHTQRPLYLGRQKRIATTDQRLICYARDRGCTRPNCLEPGYHCEVHHARPWAHGGRTNADELFFACGPTTDATDGRQHTTATEHRPPRHGPTAPTHPKSTTPTTPKNSSAATPTHPRTTHPTGRSRAAYQVCSAARTRISFTATRRSRVTI